MTTITRVGGVVVLTQVIPQNDSSIPLETTAAAAQTPPTGPQAPPQVTKAPPTKLDSLAAALRQGEQQGLGVVQIFVGVLCVLFSLTGAYSPILLVHTPLCLAATFVVSGSLALAARRRASVRLVWVSLVWNILSVVVALVGVAYVCWLLADHRPSVRFCESVISRNVSISDSVWIRCLQDLWRLNAVVLASLGVLLVLLVLQVCVSITVCVFSARGIRLHRLYTPIKVGSDDSDVGLLDGSGEETATSPPNSP